jgi:hypothetical protein
MIDLLQIQEDAELAGDQDNIDKEHKRYLDKQKVIMLNKYIFPSMANIVFFFRYISRYPEIKRVFENDIKDLLGVRRENPQEGNYGFIFSDLLCSILMPGLGYYNDEKRDKDFRLRLNQIMQETVITKAGLYLTEMFRNISMQHMVKDDFSRTEAWTEMIAYNAGQIAEDNKPPRRTIRFGTTTIREDDEWI